MFVRPSVRPFVRSFVRSAPHHKHLRVASAKQEQGVKYRHSSVSATYWVDHDLVGLRHVCTTAGRGCTIFLVVIVVATIIAIAGIPRSTVLAPADSQRDPECGHNRRVDSLHQVLLIKHLSPALLSAP